MTGQDVHNLQASVISSVGNTQCVVCTAGPLVGQDGDGLVAIVAFTHGDVGVVAVNDPVLIGKPISIDVEGVIADLVCARREGVQRCACVITTQPDSFAVVWVLSAAVVLFLAFVHDGNSVAHDRVGDDVLGQRHVVGQ